MQSIGIIGEKIVAVGRKSGAACVPTEEGSDKKRIIKGISANESQEKKRDG
jgi:hypothetical protein